MNERLVKGFHCLLAPWARPEDRRRAEWRASWAALGNALISDAPITPGQLVAARAYLDCARVTTTEIPPEGFVFRMGPDGRIIEARW